MLRADKVKDAVDMRDLVGRFARFGRRAGEKWKFHCCFHSPDNNPSMEVTEKYFICRSCGEEGDCFQFMQTKDRLNFRESMHELADMYNVERKVHVPRGILNSFRPITHGLPTLRSKMERLNLTLDPYDAIRWLVASLLPRHIRSKVRIHVVFLEPAPKTTIETFKFFFGWTGRQSDAMAAQAAENMCADYGIEVLDSDE